MNGAEREGWTRWLRTFRWDWWVTPTFTDPVTPHQALQAVRRWLKDVPNAYAAVALQRGPFGNRLHVHAVIGGTGRHPLTETALRESWRRGNIDLKGYRPCRRGIGYMVRQADDVELIGDPQPYLRRRS